MEGNDEWLHGPQLGILVKRPACGLVADGDGGGFLNIGRRKKADELFRGLRIS
jgi:hypothetical protein